ncbi:MAG: TonB-dependent receptor domain-containing protein [Fidelibacterota bacterium]
MSKYSIFTVKLILLLLVSNLLFAASAITGKITDSQNGDPLPGANVTVEGINIGSASGIDGTYTLYNIPAGINTVVFRYIGYKEKRVDVEVAKDETKVIDVEMDVLALEGQEVIVTGQAAGQRSAINQQVSAKTVKNIVSSQQIQELPEANAAEAVGRLPGVSLERSGGEGTKVMIRGMGSKYTTVQIDGVNLTATGEGDRSSDLSMISPYMLEGIELTKSVMANQEATATGGIVNFKIRKAPEKPSFNVIAQGGYHNLRDTYSDHKLSVGGSHRFVANLLGIYAQVDYENKLAGSQQLGGVNFTQENEEAPVKTNAMQLREIFRNINRLGGALVLDFTLPNTVVKTSNFYSRIKREETTYTNNYGFTEQNFGLHYSDTPESWLTVITNSLQLDRRWRNLEINSAFSHSYSENILPARISSENNNSPANPFPKDRKKNYNVNMDPEAIPDSLVISMDEVVNFMHLGNIDHEESETNERDLAGELNLSYNFNITDLIKVRLSVGAKVKYKEKEYDRTELQADNEGGSQPFRNLIYENFEDELSQRTKEAWKKDNMRILLPDFLDDDYDGGDFLDGAYNFGNIFDKEDFRKMYDLVMDEYDPVASVSDMYALMHTNFENSTFQDYHGTEDYQAAYIMPEINIGSKFMFVPGVRFESNKTEYTGYRGNRLGVLRNWRATPVDTVTKVRENDFILPMIQTFCKPVDWLTFKVGYTHTLQRPNYNNIMPGWMINNQGSIWNLSNFQLKPELSKNYDLQISLHNDKIGLFSVGFFYKEITDMIFWTGNTVIQDTAFFELPGLMHRQKAAYATNNPNDAFNYGYEVEWQSNFWFLPGMLKNLVMNVNYTRNKSEAEYLRTRIETKAEFDENYNLITYYVANDTTYKAPMIGQPNHLMNLTLGYDYKGFSIRWAMRYKSKIFTSNNWYEKLRGYSTDFYRYDLSVKQKITKKMEFFLNINNLTGELERNEIKHMNFASYIEDYGKSANMGLRIAL